MRKEAKVAKEFARLRAHPLHLRAQLEACVSLLSALNVTVGYMHDDPRFKASLKASGDGLLVTMENFREEMGLVGVDNAELRDWMVWDEEGKAFGK